MDGPGGRGNGRPGRLPRFVRAPAESAAPTTPPAEAPVDLFGTVYNPEPGTPGGALIIGDWQEATQFNPYYLGQVTEANVAASVFHTLLTITHRRPPTRDVLLSVSAGWHAHVDVLEAKLAGTKPGPHWDNWVRLRSDYDARFTA